jgi:hypothetical protein
MTTAATTRELTGIFLMIVLAFSGWTSVLVSAAWLLYANSSHMCESAWNKDPVLGVIGVQTGPL